MPKLVLLILFLCMPHSLVMAADNISIPLQLGTGFFQHQVIKKIFVDPGQTFVAWNDGSGCNHLVLANPIVSTDESGIRIMMDGEGRVGSPVGSICLPLVPWEGVVEVLMAPSKGNQAKTIQFGIVDSRVSSSDGKPDMSGAIWQWTKQYVHPRLSSVDVNIARQLMNLQSAALLLFPHADTRPIGAILTSMAIRDVSTNSEGLSLVLNMDINSNNGLQSPPEPALSAAEFARIDQVLKYWDVFVTLVAKQAAIYSTDEKLRGDLLTVLLNARYGILQSLTATTRDTGDPVRRLFLETWSKLAPLLREISIQIPGESALDFAAFIGAMDALQAIDAAGAGFNLDISTNGLRRLARLIAPAGTVDPLQYDEKVDPELRELFDFGKPVDLPQPTPTSNNSWFISSAWAQDSWSRKTLFDLNKWIPTKDNIHGYLVRVRWMLEDVVYKVLRDKPLEESFRDIFQPLTLASAWQETCWRQFIVKNGERTPITSSAGAVGIMQVSPRVWRGFYHPKPLTWDIRYNATAGTEILRHYLGHYAIRKEEHKKTNDVQNLARATYSAYHGGPGHLTRYRKKSTSKKLKNIDESFWRKYETVRDGNSLAVQQCYN